MPCCFERCLVTILYLHVEMQQNFALDVDDVAAAAIQYQ